MLFNRSASTPPRQSKARRKAVGALIDDFGTAFPAIEFRLAQVSKVINAQATLFGESRAVLLYGGLAFHPRIGIDGLCFALLHETGHHLASGGRLPWDPRLACECAADAWAATTGAGKLLEKTGRDFDLKLALNELALLEVSEGSGDGHCHEEKRAAGESAACWSKSWRARQKGILAKRAVPHDCPLAAIVLDFPQQP